MRISLKEILEEKVEFGKQYSITKDAYLDIIRNCDLIDAQNSVALVKINARGRIVYALLEYGAPSITMCLYDSWPVALGKFYSAVYDWRKRIKR